MLWFWMHISFSFYLCFVWTFTYMLVCYWLMLSFFSLLTVQIPNFRMTTLSLKQSLPSFEESVKRREKQNKKQKKKTWSQETKRKKNSLKCLANRHKAQHDQETHFENECDKIFIIQSFIVTIQNVYNPLTNYNKTPDIPIILSIKHHVFTSIIKSFSR